jgi:xanthine dehydrogenase accessory factor
VLATLYKVEGSAPRGAGAQMLFDGAKASGYFSGDCIEGDVAAHAAEVLADGVPQRLHYGMGSPWIDIRLRCGGALHVFCERIAADSAAAGQLLEHGAARRQCVWSSDGVDHSVTEGIGPLLAVSDNPFRIARRYDPPRRLIVSGGDPGALALAKLGTEAQLETILVRPDGPEGQPPLPVSQYLRCAVSEALEQLGIDRWTAFVGATHEDQHDLAACLAALRGGAAWVGMIGAKSRANGRLAALEAAGASKGELAALHLSPGIPGLGKAPWEVATGILAEVLQAMNPGLERA